MKRILIFIIYAYRWFISPFFPPTCRYTPTCSRYAIHAIESHGIIKGLWLTLKRLCRCHPYKHLGAKWGEDPVPLQSIANKYNTKKLGKKI